MSAIDTIRAKPFVNRMGIKPAHQITVAEIIADTAARHGVTVPQILGTRRHADLVEARREISWRAYAETGCSLPTIARAMNRDHTTILHGIDQYEKRLRRGVKLGQFMPTKALLTEDEIVRRRLVEGHSYRYIAKDAGVSKRRIHQVVKAHKKRMEATNGEA